MKSTVRLARLAAHAPALPIQDKYSADPHRPDLQGPYVEPWDDRGCDLSLQ
jgi:hypothetical protein